MRGYSYWERFLNYPSNNGGIIGQFKDGIRGVTDYTFMAIVIVDQGTEHTAWGTPVLIVIKEDVLLICTECGQLMRKLRIQMQREEQRLSPLSLMMSFEGIMNNELYSMPDMRVLIEQMVQCRVKRQ